MPENFDKLVKALKAQIKKDNSDMSDEDIEKKAYSIARVQFKKKYGFDPLSKKEKLKRDENGRIIIAENVNLILDGSINFIGE